MAEQPLISWAQNGEDVVLWRALGHVEHGTYVDVGAWDPDVDSVTRLFYDRGWRGVDVEPTPEAALRLRDSRPGDEVVDVAITDEPADRVVLHQVGTTGLSTLDAGLARRHEGEGHAVSPIAVRGRRLDDVLTGSSVVSDEIHFMKIDVEGSEAAVLRSLDLTSWRPWVLVVEATEPNTTVQNHGAWEPGVLAAGYRLTLFDGVSRFYVSPEHTELAPDLSYPACALDGFITQREHRQDEQISALTGALQASRDEAMERRSEALTWRNRAVDHWATAVAQAQAGDQALAQARSESHQLRRQLEQARAKLADVRAERKRLRAKLRAATAATVQSAEPRTEGRGITSARLTRAARRVVGK